MSRRSRAMDSYIRVSRVARRSGQAALGGLSVPRCFGARADTRRQSVPPAGRPDRCGQGVARSIGQCRACWQLRSLNERCWLDPRVHAVSKGGAGMRSWARERALLPWLPACVIALVEGGGGYPSGGHCLAWRAWAREEELGVRLATPGGRRRGGMSPRDWGRSCVLPSWG
jgi:hypothetical protein